MKLLSTNLAVNLALEMVCGKQPEIISSVEIELDHYSQLMALGTKLPQHPVKSVLRDPAKRGKRGFNSARNRVICKAGYC